MERIYNSFFKEVTQIIIGDFQDAILVLEDKSSKLNNQITHYLKIERHYNFQMIVMRHKPAQIDNTCRPSADTINITTHHNAAFFDNNEKVLLNPIITSIK